jgi:membrane dipeptidase
MSTSKRLAWDGYQSFQYLEPGVDYDVFELPTQIGRVASSIVPVTPEQEQRVQELLAGNLIVSLHDHPTLFLPLDPSQITEYRRAGREWTGYEGLAVSGMDAFFDNFEDGTATITSRAGWKWTDTLHDIGMRFSDLAHQDLVVRAERVDDLFAAKAAGRIALVPGLEAATTIENEIDRLDVLYGLGIRQMGIAYSSANALGAGLAERHDGGLTHFGRQVVRRMNRLGMAVDVSHSGDRTSLDAIEVSETPIFITHAGARSVWNSIRMKPDEVLDALAARGGVIGIEAAPHTTLSASHPLHGIDAVMDHFEYCVRRIGIDHVTFGPDTLFGDHVSIHQAFASQLSLTHGGYPDHPTVEFVDGLENPSECFPNIVRWLVSHGYSDEDIGKATGGNVVRVLRQVWWR